MGKQNKERYTQELQYKKEVSWLYALQKYGIKFGLSKTSNLLKAFGNPHHDQKYIHIAGTNGKGSVGAMLESVLVKSGLKVGFYSSPHLANFTERFRVNREFMKKDQAPLLIEELKGTINAKEPPTFFEFTTAMALIYFYRSNVDIGIFEAGMGGRLDATNLITPLLSIITNIGLDHQDFLGNSILDIAKEKGGIIKNGIDLITAAKQAHVVKLFKSLCSEKNAPFWRVGDHIRYRRLPTGMLAYYGLKDRYANLELGLKGRFQYRNAALALLALEILKAKGFSISESDIRSGISITTWPGRLEQVSSNPMVILDGAHNPPAMRSLADSIRNDFTFNKLILVLGVMGDKDIVNIIKEIIPLANRVIYTAPDYYRSAKADHLMEMGERFKKPGEVCLPLSAAIKRAKKLADKGDLILITGSLFCVGEAESFFDPVKYPYENI